MTFLVATGTLIFLSKQWVLCIKGNFSELNYSDIILRKQAKNNDHNPLKD